jgi:hypothetical protein
MYGLPGTLPSALPRSRLTQGNVRGVLVLALQNEPATLQLLNIDLGVVLRCVALLYHPPFIPEGVADTTQIFLRDTHILPI